MLIYDVTDKEDKKEYFKVIQGMCTQSKFYFSIFLSIIVYFSHTVELTNSCYYGWRWFSRVNHQRITFKPANR